MQQNEAQMIPQQHARHIADMINAAVQECRADVTRMSDPQAQAMFNVITEVLNDAMTSLIDYSNGKEPVWRPEKQLQQVEQRVTQKQPLRSPTVSDLAVDVDAAEPPPNVASEIPEQPE